MIGLDEIKVVSIQKNLIKVCATGLYTQIASTIIILNLKVVSIQNQYLDWMSSKVAIREIGDGNDAPSSCVDRCTK